MTEKASTQAETNSALLVEVFVSPVVADVYMALHKLDEVGVRATIQHEDLQNALGPHSGIGHGVSLLVFEQDQAKAQEVLRAAGLLPGNNDTLNDNYNGAAHWLPGNNLGSKFLWFTLLVLLLAGLTVLVAHFIAV